MNKKRLIAAFLLWFGAGAAANAQERQLLWGDTHLHSSYSVDAYATGNVFADPDVAYRYARGLPVLHPTTRQRIRIERPLDFLVVADHAEWLQLQIRIKEGDPAFVSTPKGRAYQEMNGRDIFLDLNTEESRDAALAQLYTREQRATVWPRQVDLAEKHNFPGVFTSLIGWEWSSAPDWANLHRVIFTPASGEVAKQFTPFSSFDSQKPEDLWAWLQETSERTGAEFIAIPHNSNMSAGLMFETTDSEGRAITADYASRRMRWEPVVEVTQYKGTSETHPILSPNDEFAGFEIRSKLLIGDEQPGEPGSYARSALLTGLDIGRKTGANPYKFGMIGSSDSHTGLAAVEESNFYGKTLIDPLPEDRVEKTGIFPAWELSSSGLAGVWAEENTRPSIAAAFKRKEVYATTGPRISLRVFGGFKFKDSHAGARDIAAIGYKRGTPMGGDIANAPKNKSPSLLIHAVKDPVSANLDRVQVVKGWIDENGVKQEKVFDAVWSDDRSLSDDGTLPAVGSTVDPETASYTNAIGAESLSTVWRDPEFDPALPAFYYVRVLEIPTPRHHVYDAAAMGLDPASLDYPAAIQERAYSSPIWYAP